MKNKGWMIFLIVFFSILVIVLSILLFALLSGRISFQTLTFFQNRSYEKIVDTTYERKESIEIISDASTIEIREGNEEEIHLMVYGEKKNLHVSESNQLLIEYQGKKCIGFCFGGSSKIIVVLPNTYAGNISITNQYGDISIGSFLKASISTTVNYGNIEIKDADEIKAISSAGNIQIGTVSIAKIENQFGNIEIGTVNEQMEIEDQCGDIEITSSNIKKNSSIKNSMGNITIQKSNDVYIEAETQLGNKEIKKNNPTSEIQLTIENSCGDIEVS